MLLWLSLNFDKSKCGAVAQSLLCDPIGSRDSATQIGFSEQSESDAMTGLTRILRGLHCISYLRRSASRNSTFRLTILPLGSSMNASFGSQSSAPKSLFSCKTSGISGCAWVCVISLALTRRAIMVALKSPGTVTDEGEMSD